MGYDKTKSVFAWKNGLMSADCRKKYSVDLDETLQLYFMVRKKIIILW